MLSKSLANRSYFWIVATAKNGFVSGTTKSTQEPNPKPTSGIAHATRKFLSRPLLLLFQLSLRPTMPMIAQASPRIASRCRNQPVAASHLTRPAAHYFPRVCVMKRSSPWNTTASSLGIRRACSHLQIWLTCRRISIAPMVRRCCRACITKTL
jgi:hypothetical protein